MIVPIEANVQTKVVDSSSSLYYVPFNGYIKSSDGKKGGHHTFDSIGSVYILLTEESALEAKVLNSDERIDFLIDKLAGNDPKDSIYMEISAFFQTGTLISLATQICDNNRANVILAAVRLIRSGYKSYLAQRELLRVDNPSIPLPGDKNYLNLKERKAELEGNTIQCDNGSCRGVDAF